MIEAVGVVVPVHNEETYLPACLEAIDAALDRLPRHARTFAVAVLDACEDQSSVIAARWESQGQRVALSVDFRNVGQARAAGMRAVLEQLHGVPQSRVWLASTDADSRVPVEWLSAQVDLANAGADAMAGTVRVDDWTEHSTALRDRFHRFYESAGTPEAHTHVHGTNLGVRGDAYVEAGGFSPLATGEDHALWQALARQQRSRISPRDLPVITSARTKARAPSGFSGFLSAMARRTRPSPQPKGNTRG